MVKIYMYKPLRRLKDLCRLSHYMDSKIWWSTPKSMNDAMESAYKVKHAERKEILENEELKKIYIEFLENKYHDVLGVIDCFENTERFNFWLNNKVEDNLNQMFSAMNLNSMNIGIICFSKNPDSIPMWGHYAENSTGYCLEYTFNEDKSDATPKKGMFWYNFKVSNKMNLHEPPEIGDVFFWVEQSTLMCKLKDMDKNVRVINLNFKVDIEDLNQSYLKTNKDKIIKKLTELSMIRRVAKSVIFEEDNGKNQIIFYAEVNYKEQPPVLNAGEYISRLSSNECAKNYMEKLRYDSESFLYLLENSCYVKSHDWAYEEEFRLVSNFTNNNVDGYQEIKGWFPIKLSGVIMGENFGTAFCDGKSEKIKSQDADVLKKYIIEKAKSKNLIPYISEKDLASDGYRMKHTIL